MKSHPLRVRGLKLFRCLTAGRKRMSHPLRVRGLKQLRSIEDVVGRESHPLRVRGLKLVNRDKVEITLSRTPCGCMD